MDFREYVDQAALTDKSKNKQEAIRIALFGIAGEAGEVVSEAKKYFRDGGPMPSLKSHVSEELGDLLWYIALLVRRLDLDLDKIARDNLTKTQRVWSAQMPPLSDYDEHDHDEQKLLRRFKIEFQEDRTGEIPKVRMIPHGKLSERVDRERERKNGRAN